MGLFRDSQTTKPDLNKKKKKTRLALQKGSR
jgi:hypothetical protein